MNGVETIDACVGFWKCLNPDAWLTSFGTLIGAFLGAFLAGSFTLAATKKQLKYSSQVEEKKEITAFLKMSGEFISRFSAISTLTERNNNRLDHKEALEGINRNLTVGYFKDLHTSVTIVDTEINSLNYHSAPYEYFPTYVIARENLKILKIDLEFLIPILETFNEKESIKSSNEYKLYFENASKLNELLEALRSHHNKEEEKIK